MWSQTARDVSAAWFDLHILIGPPVAFGVTAVVERSAVAIWLAAVLGIPLAIAVGLSAVDADVETQWLGHLGLAVLGGTLGLHILLLGLGGTVEPHGVYLIAVGVVVGIYAAHRFLKRSIRATGPTKSS